MPWRWRSILATILVLAFAAFEYIHCAVPTLEIATPSFSFDSEKGTIADIPPDIRRFDGRTVAVEGYMVPMDLAEDIHQFAILPALTEEGWPRPYSLHQIVIENSARGLAFNPEKIRVTGRLHVRLTTDEGFHVSVYDMDTEQVSTICTGPAARWPWAVIGVIPSLGIALLLRRWIIRRRLRRVGCCMRCGYDLRATPARCPECGLVPD